ncbi:MAG: hypothetical protein ACTSX6_04015 [Candidatus Heimdallarchaeaceae archaeon]
MNKHKGIGIVIVVMLFSMATIFLVTRHPSDPCVRKCNEIVNKLERAYNCGLDEGIVCCDQYKDRILRNYCITGALDKIRPKATRTNIDGILDSLRNFCIKACKTREIKNDKE